ncbi:MAG: nucleotide sugar dehydrogenase, partial [Gammaproteobacteria bacterium]
VHDPLADPAEARHEYGIELEPELPPGPFDIVVLAVPHGEYLELGVARIRQMVAPDGVLADLKGALGSFADWSL